MEFSYRVEECIRDVRASLSLRPPGLVRESIAAMHIVREVGLRPSLGYVTAVLLSRMHDRLFERRQRAEIPHSETGRVRLTGLQLNGCEREVQDALPCAPMPSKPFHWALSAFSIDPRRYHFVDIGAGWGYALLLAASYPFRQVTGIEFAEELHAKASANLAWAKSAGRIKTPHAQVRCESALQADLPQGPSLLFLFHPFREAVLREFVEHVEESIRKHPRPVVVLYANPADRHVFDREGVIELKSRGLTGWLLWLFSPFAIRAYAFTRPPPPVTE